MPNNQTSKIFGLTAVLLFSALACRAVTNLVFPPTPTPISSASTVVPSLQSIPTLDSPDPIHCTDDSCLQACLERLDEVLETRPFDPIDNPIYEQHGANFDLVLYKVEGDEISDPTILYVPAEYRKYQEDTAAHRRIWDFYTTIIPAELRATVTEFVIYTDGSYGDTAAWVMQSDRDPDEWRVGFDLLDSDYPPFLANSLVHETGHLLTLNTSQVPRDEDVYYWFDGEQNWPTCDQYVADGGCSLPDSYINQFHRRFWEPVYREWWEIYQEAENAATFDEYKDIMRPFYDRHPDMFLNDYAATHIDEDMAESFSYFVLHARPDGHSIADEKVAFYYEYPELVEYRRQIIEGLCSYVR